ncbi:MAG: dTDP-4-dehydrorhamnose 3,5-epimerase family protein [Candidatus Zixiibacteriota bacterium]
MINNVNIDGIIIRKLPKYSDNRGWLTELFRKDELPNDFIPEMSYVSLTHPGQIRGPHEHTFQTDYFCILQNSKFALYFWDNRHNSATFGNRFKVEYDEENIICIIIPPGIVHAYKNIGNRDGFIINFPNRLYAGKGKNESPDEIRYEEKTDNRFQLFD